MRFELEKELSRLDFPYQAFSPTLLLPLYCSVPPKPTFCQDLPKLSPL